MTSRLDRLFVLLDTGSSPVTRKAAALQLGEVQKLHPHELHNLLNKVHHFLRSTQWESRIAAGEAIEAIVKNVPQWCPVGNGTGDGQVDLNKVSMTGRMKFEQFDINKVLRNGACLLASEGGEFEMEEIHGVEQKELLAHQRSLLNKRLGFDEKIGFDSTALFSNEDLQIAMPVKSENKEFEISKKAIAEMVAVEMSNLDPGLSSRERNRAKRKAKLIAKQRSQEAAKTAATNPSKNDGDESDRKRRKMHHSVSREESHLIDNSSNSSSLFEESNNWPFEFFCDQLCQDLFHPSWEVRHGAATALRAIVRIHGTGAGRTTDMGQSQMEHCNQVWLEDTALRLLCGIALDRFGDFISDQVVAPVRETCTQTLAAVFNIMNKESVFGVTHVLLQLLKQPEWEARHGGLLGMKYLLAVRQDLTVELLHLVFTQIYEGLKDEVDDVCAVAAAALVPISDILVKEFPAEVPGMISTLWCLLLDQDDVTTSTNSIMTLLASLLSYPLRSTHYSPSSPLNELVPRLWPFLGHSSSSVRKGALQTLFTLTSGNNPEPEHDWLSPILSDALKHIYQRCILEHVGDILDLIYELWQQVLAFSAIESLLAAACPALSGWLCLAMQPSSVPIPFELLVEAKHKIKEKTSKCRHPSFSDGVKDTLGRHYISGSESLNDSGVDRSNCVIRARCFAAKLLGSLSCYVTRPMPGIVYIPEMESPLDSYAKLLLFHLGSRSALQRVVIGLVVMEWAKQVKEEIVWPPLLVNKLIECLNENVYYDEIMIVFSKLQQECRDFIALLQHHNINIDSIAKLGTLITTTEALEICNNLFPSMIQQVKLKPKTLETLEERRRSLTTIALQAQQDQNALQVTVQATLAGAVVCIEQLPEKLNPIIKPLMDSIKKEENESLQQITAVSLTKLLSLCTERSTCPNAKIIKNLCNFVASDQQYTPRIDPMTSANSKANAKLKNGNPSQATSFTSIDSFCGIITLLNMQKNAEKCISIRRSNSVSKSRVTLGLEMSVDDTVDDEAQQQAVMQRRGAQFALIEIARSFGTNLPEKLPKLWEMCLGPLTETIDPNSLDYSKKYGNDVSAQELVNALQVLEVMGPALHLDLKSEVVSKLPHLCQCLNHPYTAVRHMAARCIGMLSKIATVDTMNLVLTSVLPWLDNSDNDTGCQGAIEVISNIIDCLGFDLVPYIALLVIPVLGRMSDSNIQVRLTATHCFATLIRLMPLEGGVIDPVGLDATLVKKKQQERCFLDQLFDIKKLKNYEVPVPVSAQLRTYQQDGINWLAFLNTYKLHGILCDDMGLGKTLQSLCMLAGDHYYQEQEVKKCAAGERKRLPSIVICPPTLTGHWIYEVEKFIEKNFLNPLHYTGPPVERQRLRSYFNKSKKHNLVIVSYDIVRNDIDFFSSIRWNYCILDEGHIIKNGKTKLSKAIKQLVANHRLILSGTPIQNNVLELWSLFDFLMPGFLGTEKQFMARYSKPILLSRDAKSSSKEQEAGALAMEALHRQVLPFLLRRMKEDVLQDLPPKIIQDYYCELSSLQKQLYEDFSKSRAKRSLDDCLLQDESYNNQSTSHIFQALQYLRKVCNHPKLVLTPAHPEFEKLNQSVKEQNSSLADISHAAKLLALKQLLLDCGIGTEQNSSETTESVVNQHRALIFCQLKGMLDILEKDLFKIHLPTVTYLRLDGSIPPGSRYDVVHRFNNDPSIDVLLLTTRVGGLGLNLTGADTVIFVEHDWNPMKDLQAMDRVHRIGQKKVVNVYRLITKGTLEEKIMGLQKFKLTIANTVISQDNSSLLSMGTDQLLDLFSLGEGGLKSDKSKAETGKGSNVNNILESLPELWDEKQYEEEYDLNSFMQTLQK